MSRYSRSQNPKVPEKKGVIIFDFDGVLADSFDTFYNLIKDSMAMVGVSISEDNYRELFKDNVHKGFEKIISNSKKYELFRKIRKSNYNKYYKKYGPKLFRGVSKLLRQLDKNYIITVASSGRRDNIIGLLRNGGVHKYFDLVLATDEHSKENMIKEILQKHKADPRKTIMITDTTGDIKIAKKLGLRTIAVSWGFHRKETVKKSGADHIADTLGDILKILN